MNPKSRLTSIKAFGFTAIVALVATAFIGTTSANATALCKADEEPCAAGNLVTSVHEASVGNAKLLTSFGTVECSVLFATTKVGAPASPQRLEGSFTYSSCKLGSTGCTFTEENGPAEILISKEGHETAKVTGERLAHLVCGSSIDCSYNGIGLVGTAKGPLLAVQANGEVLLSEQSTTKETGGFLCPKTSKLDIATTPLTATYISSGGSPTSIATLLKGGGKEGAEITVAEGSKVKDTATLSGENASKATGTLTYKVFSDSKCEKLATEAGKVAVKEGKVPDSEEKTLEAGKEYFWQAEYSGDEANKASTSVCSKEVLSVVSSAVAETTIEPGTYRHSTWEVAGGGGYNYAPSVMLDGNYRTWWCGGIAGDHILYAESSNVNGPYHAHGSNALYQDVLQPSPGSSFDGTHTCDPSVIRVHGTYYMYFGGLTDGSGLSTQIGAASSPDGINWTKLNGGNPIVSPRSNNASEYGAGQPSTAFVDGYFYLMYTDSSGLNGGTQYAIRSTDPSFQSNVETATASGFVPRTPLNYDTFTVSQSFSPDWQYSDALEAWIVLSNQEQGKTFVRFLAKDLSHVLRPDLTFSPIHWKDGPGVVSTPEKHALAPPNGECQRIVLNFLNASSAGEPPNELMQYGVDLNTHTGCGGLSSSQIAGMYNGYGIVVGGMPLTVVVEKTRLQFALAAPASDLTNNFVDTSQEAFNAIPYGASLQAGAPMIGASGRPAAFVLDESLAWPVSSMRIVTDNGSQITMVSPSFYDLYQQGPPLFVVPYFPHGNDGYRLVSRHSGKCMSLSENKPANGTGIIQWTCSGAPSPGDGQVFNFVPMGESLQVRINSSNKCLDVTGASQANGAWLQEYDCLGAGQTNQLWSVVPLASQPGWFGLVAKHSNKCADVTGVSSADGARIQQWECTWAGNQQWRLEPVS